MSDLSHKRMNISAALASVAAALSLVLIKLWAVAQTGSLSVAASLADSALDLMVSLGALAAIIYAARPADDDHRFGHTAAEDLAALAQAVFITVSGLVIAWAGVTRLLSPEPPALEAQGSGIAVMVASMVITIALIAWQTWVARRTKNRVVMADRLHYLADLIPALGAILSLWASAAFGITEIDSIVALGTAILLLYGALNIGRGAFDALMDRSADPEIIDGITTLARNWPGVDGFHDLKTRVSGSKVFVNLHIELDGELNLREAHDIGAGLKRTILLAYPQTDVIIHKDVSGAPKSPHAFLPKD